MRFRIGSVIHLLRLTVRFTWDRWRLDSIAIYFILRGENDRAMEVYRVHNAKLERENDRLAQLNRKTISRMELGNLE